MRFLGESFGYNLPSMPMIGQNSDIWPPILVATETARVFVEYFISREGAVHCGRKEHMYLHFAEEIHLTLKFCGVRLFTHCKINAFNLEIVWSKIIYALQKKYT